jgi:hypothetical protein
LAKRLCVQNALPSKSKGFRFIAPVALYVIVLTKSWSAFIESVAHSVRPSSVPNENLCR